MKYFIMIISVLFSYTIIENIIRKLFPNIGKRQLWTHSYYYLWGLILLILAYYTISINLVFSTPKNHNVGITMLIAILLSTFIFLQSPAYYPNRKDFQKCIHYALILPLFEEVAFRGLLLPMTIIILNNSIQIEMIIILNAVLFTLFHRNYWSFHKAHTKYYLNFFLLGLIFTITAYYTNTILYSLICHVIVNGGNTLYRNYKTSKTT